MRPLCAWVCTVSGLGSTIACFGALAWSVAFAAPDVTTTSKIAPASGTSFWATVAVQHAEVALGDQLRRETEQNARLHPWTANDLVELLDGFEALKAHSTRDIIHDAYPYPH